MADEELTEQEKMDRMIAELSADIEDVNKEGKEGDPESEKTFDGGEEPKEPESEGEGVDEELTDQEKMDSMIVELSEEDIEKIDKEETEGEPGPEGERVEEEKGTEDSGGKAKGEEPKEQESEREGEEEEKESEEPGADEKEDGSEETTTEEGKEEKEKDLGKTTSEKKAAPDKPATENLAIGPDLYQEESDADEDAGDEESDENIDERDEYESPDIKEDDHGGKRRRNAIVWSVIAILALGSSFAWLVYYKNVNMLEYPILSQWVQKLRPKPAVKDTKELGPQLPKNPATGLHVKTPQTSVSSSSTEMTSGHLNKSEMFEQKIEQILAVRDKLSEKRTQAASIREKLNEQILALKREILAEQRELGLTSYEEAVKSPRIYYNIKLIQQLKAYTSKLAERVRYFEDGYDKMSFRYQEADDNFKMIELWSDTKNKKLMAKIDEAMNEYLSVNKPHMFTNKEIVLDNPRKIWTEVIHITGE